MIGFIDMNPAVRVQPEEYIRLLGYPPGHEPSARAAGLAAWAEEWYARHGRPWIYARQAGDLGLAGGRVRLAGREFSPARLAGRMAAAGAHDAVAVAVSAGGECEEAARSLWEEGKPDEYFFLEIYGSAVVEHLVASAGYRLCEWAEGSGLAILPHDSPGYPGWDISEQAGFLACLRRDPAPPLHEAIDVLPSGMLRPKKSLLALFGVAARNGRTRDLRDLVPCVSCALPGCAYRRSPYAAPCGRRGAGAVSASPAREDAR